ncbi:agamous-like MADS-box protein AGL80 [Neltuma alba]|uniref:agamous-like MADS-box protein AGL80 n=1 Tax=Neltuma alba TaxID=207710 RepID=UPI0010A3AD96|nr:agamous-like MADS-box protein AGL80 [Prosopis alba]
MSEEAMKHQYITDDLKRKASFKKREAIIMKKISELSILCGVEAGAIIYSGRSDPQPEVWPDHEGVQQVIERCRGGPVSERALNKEATIQKRIKKGKELLMRRRKENRTEEISQLMIRCMLGKATPSPADWHDMKMVVEQTLKKINS